MKPVLKKKTCASELAVYVMYAVMMAGIVAVCLLLPGIAYAKKRSMAPNWILLPCALAVCALCVPLVRRLGAVMGKRGFPMLLGVSLAALLFQIVAVRSYYFYTDWDVETIVECALSFIDGKDISRHSNYFSMYQNNLVLVTLFGWVARLVSFLGMKEHAYFALIVFQCLISWATAMLMCRLIRHLTQSDAAVLFGCLLYALLVGLSPWVSIPYSDSVALLFPVAILVAWLTMPRHGAAGMARWFLVLFLSYFGYRIKPQILIVLIAIVLIRLGGWLFSAENRGQKARVRGKELFAACAGLLSALLLCGSMAAQVQVPIDENKQMGIAHFLMMGLNEEEFGAYAQRDVSYSWRIETREERTAANLKVAAERVQSMGLSGLCKQFLRKTLTNYNDGTFCWGGEGVFYREILPAEDGMPASLFRNLYYGPQEVYQGEYGRYYSLWQNGAHAVWMLVLVLSAFSVLGKRDERLALIMLTLIGLTIFETLFEARARYLYGFLPLYMTLAACGLERLCRMPGLLKRRAARRD